MPAKKQLSHAPHVMRGPLTRADLPPDLAALYDTVRNPNIGFFGPDSMSWRIAREAVMLFGGYRALILQLAHPHVAEGVANHSNFQQDSIGRAIRTFNTVAKMIFGSREDALTAALRSRHIHTKVKGTLPEDVGKFAAGSKYHANRADLLFWVHATLQDSAIMGYETFVGPLRAHEKERYYQEGKIFARLFGTPISAMPETYPEFQTYFTYTVENTLEAGDSAKKLYYALAAGKPYLKAVRPLNEFFTAGFLPPKLRSQFGLPWSPVKQVAFDQSTRALRLARLGLPNRVRFTPYYYQAVKRLGMGVPQ